MYVVKYKCPKISEKRSHDFEGKPEGLYGKDLR